MFEMLKPYDELVKVDISKYCEEREGFLYLNWARCIDLLRKNFARTKGRVIVCFAVIQNLKIRTEMLTNATKLE